MSGTIKLDVYVSPYKPIVTLLPTWDTATQATWPASSVSLLTGEREAVLVDALITFAEAKHVVEWIRATGKTLTTVYITHGHGDHFFGLNTILAAFPGARAVTVPEVVPFAEEQVSPGYMAVWGGWFPGQIPEHPIVPVAIEGNLIDLEGHELRLVNVGQSDTSPSTVVHIPDLDAVVGGDVAYNGIHMWLADTDHEKRLLWLRSLDTIESLAPMILVAGHKDPAARDDDVAAILAASRQYIRDFDQAVAVSHSPEELVATMMASHGDRGNPFTLWNAAQGVRAQLSQETAKG